MKRTAYEITMMFGAGCYQVQITIPAGTLVSPAGDGQFFVEDLSWLYSASPTWRDAYYNGILLTADQVT